MKSLLRLVLVALGLLWPTFAFAANCVTTAYANGATGGSPWASNGTTTWCTLSTPLAGGCTTGGAYCTLVAGNAIVFDANTTAGVYNLAASISISSLTSSGAAAGVYLTHANAVVLTVNNTTSSTTFDISGISYCNADPCTGAVAAPRAISFTNTGGTVSITTGASTTAPYNQFGTVTFNGSGGTFELLDNAIFQAAVTLTAGTLDATTNNTSPTLLSMTTSSGSQLNCGTGTWTLNASTSFWTVANATQVSCGSATITFNTATAGGNRSFNTTAGSASYGTLNIANTGASGSNFFIFTNAISTTQTFANMNFTNIASNLLVNFQANSIYAITNAPSWSGSANNEFLEFESTSLSGTSPTITTRVLRLL